MNRLINKQPVRDWRLSEVVREEDIPAEDRGTFELTHDADIKGQQHYMTIASKECPGFGADLVLEVNRGVPCLHITNDIAGDTVLHVYFTKDGITLVPEDPTVRPLYVRAERFYQGTVDAWLFPNEIDLPEVLEQLESTGRQHDHDLLKPV